MDLRTFHNLINPDNAPIYLSLRNGNIVGSRVIGRSLTEIGQYAREDTNFEVGAIIPNNYLIMQIEDKTIVDLIIQEKENIWIFETPEGYNLVGQSLYDKTTTNNILACGVKAHTLSSKSRTKNYIPLPFRPRTSTSEYLKKHSLIYASDEIGYYPAWLEPTLKISRDQALDALSPPY